MDNQLTHDESIDQFISSRLPDWMRYGKPEQLAALRQSLVAAHQLQGRLQPILQGIKAIDAFAAPLLRQALLEKTGLEVDVLTSKFDVSWRTLSGVPTLTTQPTVVTHHFKQTLVQAALHNFEPEETRVGRFSPATQLTDADKTELDIQPEKFATVCRDIDLGGQYQAHLASVFNPPDAQGVPKGQARQQLHELLEEAQRLDMEVALCRAALMGAITSQRYARVKQLVSASTAVPNDVTVLNCRQVNLLGKRMVGIVVIEVRRDAQTSSPVVGVIAYVPDDPHGAISEHSSWAELFMALGKRLRAPGYMEFFQRFVRERDRTGFSQTLARLLQTGTATDSLELDGRDFPYDARLFAALRKARIDKVKDDARVLAVPTGDEDRAARAARLDSYLSVGLNLLNLAALFVPGLGEVMLSVAAVQIASEVYHGFEDWQQGDREGALNHLLGVAENVAATAALVAGGTVVTKVLKRSAFVDDLVPVKLADGSARLWNNDLSVYRVAGRVTQVGSEHRLKLQEATYQVGRAQNSGEWCVLHPARSDNYAPMLEHNGAGGWRHRWDSPQYWQGDGNLFRRLGQDTEVVSDALAETVMKVTGFDELRLRQLHLSSASAPARLLDCLDRFTLQQQITDLAAHLAGNRAVPTELMQIQAYTLTALEHWPESTALRVKDAEGRRVLQFGGEPQPSSFIDVTEEQVSARTWIDTVLANLDDQQKSALLSADNAAHVTEAQHLARAMSKALPKLRAKVFEHFYSAQQLSADKALLVLRRDFPGLSRRMGCEILEQASSKNLQRVLSTQRLPLDIAEQARWALRESRLDRANAGLFLKEAVSEDSEKLALGLIGELAPWPESQRVELREATPNGAVLVSVGTTDAKRVARIVKTADGYFTVDQAGGGVSTSAGSNGLFQALARTLSDEQWRILNQVGQPSEQALRDVLAAAAVTQRDRASRLIGQVVLGKGFRPPIRLGDGQIGYPLSGRGAGEHLAITHAIRALYPTFTEIQVLEYISEVRATGSDIWTHVIGRQQQLDLLYANLHAWETELDAAETLVTACRVRVGRRIRRCWRRQTARRLGRDAGSRLLIEGELVGELPALSESIDFSHVSELTLRSLDLTSINEGFLARFTGLRRLELVGNHLTEIPATIARRAELTELHLAHNQIRLSAHGNALLSSLGRLEVLDLDHNPVGLMLDTTALHRLRVLRLRNTQLVALPSGLLSRPALELADLRENQIRSLPEALFNTPRRVLEHINFHDNPLSPESRSRLINFERAGQVAQTGAFNHSDTQLGGRDQWLMGTSESLLAQRRGQWDRLALEAGSSDFFRLLADLRQSQDFRLWRSDLERRVWEVIEGCEQSYVLRRELFELAARPTSCVDSVTLSFSQLEVRTWVLSATRDIEESKIEHALLGVARALFRLDEVDRIAALDIQERQRLGATFDEIEVRLAYRVGLARTLELPGQPHSMRFESMANVSSRQLLAVRGQVLTAEQTPRLAASIVGREFWCDHLLSLQASEFEQTDQPFFERVEALAQQEQGLRDVDYLREMDTIATERETARQVLIRRLTDEALQRNP